MAITMEFINGINPWWEDKKYKYQIKERLFYTKELIDQNNRLIKILIGARRVGKTSIMQSCINTLLRTNPPLNIIYISADLPDVRANGIKATLEDIVKNHAQDLFKSDLHIFIDEVEEVDNWQDDIKLLYDNTKLYFYLTGSSSLLLKKQTSKLTGRFILNNVLPLSYNEFKDFYQGKEKTEGDLLEAYLKIGGYPEYVLSKNASYLQQAIESTLYRELLDHYGIRNPRLLTTLLKFLADKVTTPVSANRISEDLDIDDKTAKFYLEYLESVFLIYPVYKYGLSHKISKSSIPKYYFNDTGILNLYSIRPRIGHLTENIVFLELLRRNNKRELSDIYYEVINSQEIDFKQKDILYEVKGHSDLEKKDLDKYELMNKDVNVVISSTEEELEKLPYYPSIKYISLMKFLAS